MRVSVSQMFVDIQTDVKMMTREAVQRVGLHHIKYNDLLLGTSC